MVLAILGDDGSSSQTEAWQADIATVQIVFRHILAANPLAARCADILDRILQPEPDTAGVDVLSVLSQSSFDFSTWPSGDSDMLNSFGWLDPSPGI